MEYEKNSLGDQKCLSIYPRTLKWCGLEGRLKILIPAHSAMSRDTSYLTRFLKAPSCLALSIFRDGASKASLGKICHFLTTLTANNFFLLSNLLSFSLKHYLLSYHSMSLPKVCLWLFCSPSGMGRQLEVSPCRRQPCCRCVQLCALGEVLKEMPRCSWHHLPKLQIVL